MKILMLLPPVQDLRGGVEKYVRSLLIETEITDKVTKLHSDQTTEEEFDLCISHSIFFPAKRLARLHLHIFHGTILGNWRVRPWLLLHPLFWRWFKAERKAVKNADLGICVSQNCQKEVALMGFQKPLFHVHSGGGQEQDFQLRQFDQTRGLNFCFNGRIEDKVKRFELVKKVFEDLYQSGCEATLHVIGSSSKSKEKNILYHGTLPEKEVQAVRALCQGQINASYYEGYSLALAEGIFQNDLLTFVTPSGGNKELLGPGVEAFHSPEELKARILYYAEYPEELPKSRLALRQRNLIQSWASVWQKIRYIALEHLP